MKHALYKGIVVVLLAAVLTSFGMAAASVGAYEASNVSSAVAAVQATEAADEATAEASGVTNLPETGRGTGSQADDAGVMALHQMLMTILILLAAAILALGGIALVWRYDRR